MAYSPSGDGRMVAQNLPTPANANDRLWYRVTGDTSGTVQTGSLITATAYDGLGRRITKTVQNHGDHNAVQHTYYDGQRQVEERNGSDLVMQQRIWGLSYIDELIAGRP